MSNRRENDEINKLLDSFDESQILEEKMEGFANQRRKKEQPVFKREQPEIEKQADSGDTVVLSAKDVEPKQSAAQTMMFDKDSMEQSNPNKTVVINDDEIQSLLEEDQAPKLRREVIGSKTKTTVKKPAKRPSTKKGLSKGAIIAIVISVVLAIGVIGASAWMVFFNKDEEKTEEVTKAQEEAYDRIVEWIENVEDDDYSDIEDYEDDYNKLTDDQKDEIDTLLKRKTGYKFNTLLAHEKSGEKQESSNNNSKIAELKAKQESLESELSSAQEALDNAKATLSSVTDEYNSISGQYQTAVDAYNAFQNASNELNNWVNGSEGNRYFELSNKDQSELTEEELKEVKELAQKYVNLQNNVNTAQSTMNSAGDRNTLKSQMDSAAKEVQNAQSAVDEAQSEVDDLKSQISSIQKQISALE